MELSELLRDGSLIIGIWVAIYGIDSWRRSHVGIRRIELAEDSLALFYEAADAIRHMRHPMSWGGETDDVAQAEGESTSNYEARKNASVAFKRYNQHQELFNKLHAMRYRFMAQIGKDEAESFEKLHDIVNEVITSARMLARLWPRDHFRTQEQWDKHQIQIEKYEAIFWDANERDPINPRLDAVCKEMESTCKAVISAKGTLYGLLNKPIFKKS